MKNLNLCLLLVFFFCNVSFSQSDSTGTVTDIDGNVYQTVKIGDQWWMAENLKVTHYQNGDSIPNVTDYTQWANLTTGAYCNYNNDSTNVDVAIYGGLYNWYAVDDSRNIAPAGWHVPTDGEWQTLVDFLGDSSVAGGKLKSTGTIEGGDGLWLDPNEGATNESGFSALPGGYRSGWISGGFRYVGVSALFWSSTEVGSDDAWARLLNYFISGVGRLSYIERDGFSVRCIRDDATIIESSAQRTITNPNLAQNYPNPFNPSTTIEFSLPKSEYVELKVFNILGKEVLTIVSKKLNQGNHTYQFDGKNLASGIYYNQLIAGNYREVKKMILLR